MATKNKIKNKKLETWIISKDHMWLCIMVGMVQDICFFLYYWFNFINPFWLWLILGVPNNFKFLVSIDEINNLILFFTLSIIKCSSLNWYGISMDCSVFGI